MQVLLIPLLLIACSNAQASECKVTKEYKTVNGNMVVVYHKTCEAGTEE